MNTGKPIGRNGINTPKEKKLKEDLYMWFVNTRNIREKKKKDEDNSLKTKISK